MPDIKNVMPVIRILFKAIKTGIQMNETENQYQQAKNKGFIQVIFMKILAILGSPRRKSCYSAISEIKRYFADNGCTDFKIIELAKMKLDLCKGCLVCIKKGEKYCPLRDKRDLIIDEIKHADGIILASPVYCFNVTAIMKNLIDRLGFMAHRPLFLNKHAMVIASCAGDGVKETNNYMKRALTMFGFNVVSDLELRTKLWPLDIKDGNRIYIDTVKAAGKLLRGIKKGKIIPPKLYQIITFNIFKKFSAVKKEFMPADHEYYKDKKIYHYDAKINVFKKILAGWITRNIS
ncbi:MAG: flavodoxin family protein [Spirochaetes bacterium]|nr:flavodoxin family protein [Spirochaetota bacterium]